MDVFTVGLFTLFTVVAIFYVVLFSFIYYWHLVHISYMVVPIIHAFEIFLKGLIAVAIVSIILYYTPVLIGLYG